MSPYCATDLSRTGGTVNAPKLPYETGVVFSADGTPIGYRRLGAGPGLILLSGGYLAAQHYMGWRVHWPMRSPSMCRIGAAVV